MWRPDDPQGKESRKIAHMIVPWTRGKGLDLGCGPERAYPHMIGMDGNRANSGGNGATIVGDCTKLGTFADASMDFVFSSHLLEHIVDTRAALAEWWRVIKPGGSLVLYLPHRDFYPNIGEDGANPDHKHDFLPEDILAAMRDVAPSWLLAENEERNQGQEYSFYQVFIKTEDGQQVARPWRKDQPTCLVIRYGGIGDMLMVTSVLPGLKAQGYRITMNCTPTNFELLKHDPHIADWWLQDKDQVPNAALGGYWGALRHEGRWDKIVNLCESIERSLLTIPSDLAFYHSDEARRRVVGKVNYVQRTHEIADVPFEKPQIRFYMTKEECDAAVAFRNSTGARRVPVVAWVPNGSSQHKHYSFTDILATWVLKNTPAHLVMLGDGATSVVYQERIEETLKKNGCDMSRWHPKAGKWSAREALTFVTTCADVVVGPETGMLNAVSSKETVAKVIMLSHSSAANLTRDWANTTVMTPSAEAAPCYPCHRMHYDIDHCPQNEQHQSAKCAAGIEPKALFEAVKAAIKQQHARLDPSAFPPPRRGFPSGDPTPAAADALQKAMADNLSPGAIHALTRKPRLIKG